MKIFQHPTSKKQFLTIVACQHGNEPFGLEVIHALKPRLNEFPGLQLIIANEEALSINKRGVDGDLNRSYPGDPKGNHETRLAHELLERVKESTYLLDIHTSVSSCGFLVPIVTQINSRTQTLINLLKPSRVVCVEKPLSATSLIGSVQAGLSLEFQKSLADHSAVNVAVQLVEDLYAARHAPQQKRDVFFITDVIAKDLLLPETARDFELIEELGIYPVLLKDPNYMGNQGLMATRKETMLI